MHLTLAAGDCLLADAATCTVFCFFWRSNRPADFMLDFLDGALGFSGVSYDTGPYTMHNINQQATSSATTKVHTIESFLRVAVGDAGALSMILSFSLPSTLTHTSLLMLESSSFSYPKKHHQCINRHSKPHTPAKNQKASTKNVASD